VRWENKNICGWPTLLVKSAKNCCKRTISVQLIVEDVVTCFLEHMQCRVITAGQRVVQTTEAGVRLFDRDLRCFTCVKLLLKPHSTAGSKPVLK